MTETLMRPRVSGSRPGPPALRLLGTSRLSPGFSSVPRFLSPAFSFVHYATGATGTVEIAWEWTAQASRPTHRDTAAMNGAQIYLLGKDRSMTGSVSGPPAGSFCKGMNERPVAKATFVSSLYSGPEGSCCLRLRGCFRWA